MKMKVNPAINQINKLPSLPGCYLFKNKTGEIIYIGKSKSLYHRVKQYFTGFEQKSRKLILLANEIYDLDYIVTDCELDAILMECRLIKQHQPKFNTLLKMSPNFVFLKIHLQEQYPGITVETEIENKNKKDYCCLFYSEKEAVETIHILNRIFYTPICSKKGFYAENKPCFYYDIKKCTGPCDERITKEEYNKLIFSVIDCLNGKSKKVIQKMNQEMNEAAANLDFEKAAALRDKINELNLLKRKSNRLHLSMHLKNLFVFLRPFYQARISIMYLHNNQMVHRIDFEGINEITMERLIIFTEEIEAGLIKHCKSSDKTDVMEEAMIDTQHLLEVYCDKYFLPIYRMTNPESTAKRLFQTSKKMKSKDFE